MGCKSKFDSSFKNKLAIEAVKEQRTLQEIAKEFNVYLNAIIDVYSRYILGWRLSNDLTQATAPNCLMNASQGMVHQRY